MQKSDVLVIWLILIALVLWIWIPVKRRLSHSRVAARPGKIPVDDVIENNETVELLEGAGFDVLSAKQRIPVYITVNDTEELESRLYIDYFVRKDGEYYIVKVAKHRRPVELKGAAMRDAWLSYSLLYPEAAGVLYLDMQARKIKKISFSVESE